MRTARTPKTTFWKPESFPLQEDLRTGCRVSVDKMDVACAGDIVGKRLVISGVTIRDGRLVGMVLVPPSKLKRCAVTVS